MKFIAVVCLMLALLGLTLALKHRKFYDLFKIVIQILINVHCPLADCGLPPASDGNGLIKCAAYVPSFSYYPEENSCKSFVFGGCGGNNNRFTTEEACESKCKE
ncbi:hypothetical protein KR074_001463 [Drosophila pseudoananassae]|nr:hypothetical protein KR074_001463 [Drosophila pseudoananassae]